MNKYFKNHSGTPYLNINNARHKETVADHFTVTLDSSADCVLNIFIQLGFCSYCKEITIVYSVYVVFAYMKHLFLWYIFAETIPRSAPNRTEAANIVLYHIQCL